MKASVRAACVLTAIALAVLASYLTTLNIRTHTKLTDIIKNTQHLTGDANRGEYVANMGGCIACHTDLENGGKPLAGGVALETPFGTFYSPNITSDTTAGIGSWTESDFIIALSVGIAPNGSHYYPAFPYTSYSVLTPQDIVDLKTWLDTVQPVESSAPTHDIAWPVSIRSTLLLWKALFFEPTREVDIGNRGEYLVNGPTHCAECHSSRNWLGGLSKRTLSGNKRGPEGHAVPAITLADLGDWTKEDMELFLEVGITPAGDFAGGHMTDVIEYSTGRLTAEDRSAIADYLLSESNRP